MRFALLSTSAVAAMVLLSGCQSNGTVAEIKELPGGRALLTSADLRAVNQVRAVPTVAGRLQPEWITCAEPSPDVAKAVAEALDASTAISVEGLPSNVSPEVAAAFSRSRAEAIAQLAERLATIQLLRDGLYRSCEAYANGAISDTTYAVMLGGYDDTMITMLLGEFAAGAFGRAMAAAGTEASGTASALLEVAAAKEAEEEAEAKLDEAKQELEEAEAAAAASGSSGVLTTASAEAARDPGGEEVAEAKEEVAKAEQDLRRKQDAKAESEAKALQLTAGGGSTASGSAAIAETLATMQRKYIENINSDALEIACISAIDRRQAEATPLAAYCRDRLLPGLQESRTKLLALILARAWQEADNAQHWRRIEAGEAPPPLLERLDEVDDELKRISATLASWKGAPTR